MKTEQEEIELLPCPFCGGTARLWPQGHKRGLALVSCGTCQTSGRKSTPRCVVTAWNTRTALPQHRIGGTRMMKSGIDLIAEERKRQIEVEGWTPEHDAEHSSGEMALAAVCYAHPRPRPLAIKKLWPWDWSWWKPTLMETVETFHGREQAGDRTFVDLAPNAEAKATIRDLVKAGALIAAEIDRLKATCEEKQR